MKSTTTVTIDVELKKLAQDLYMNISQASEVGIRMLVAEQRTKKEGYIDLDNYPDSFLKRRIIQLTNQLNGDKAQVS